MRNALLTSASVLAFMSEMTDTVTISTDNGPVRINAADFDKKKHTLHKEDKDELPQTQVNTFVAPVDSPIPASAPIVGGEQTMHPGAHQSNADATVVRPEGDGERRVVLSEPVPPAAQSDGGVSRQVAKIGSKFFVVDAQGNKIEAEGINDAGYKTEADAWKAANPALAPSE